MRAHSLVHRVLADEALTRGLGDEEARVLVEWLVEKTEWLERNAPADAAAEVGRWCRRCRAIGRFVALWNQRATRGAALQLAGAERFNWPLPDGAVVPCDLMADILDWEDRAQNQRLAS